MKKQIQLPAHLVEYLRSQTEPDMRYHIVDLRLRDGSALPGVVVVNASFVLVDSGIDSTDIVGVELAQKPPAA